MIEQIRITRFDFKPVCDECGHELLTGPQQTGGWREPRDAADAARKQGWQVGDYGHATCERCIKTEGEPV